MTFADIPIQVTATLIYGLVTYFLTMQPIEGFRLLYFLIMCILVSLVAQSFGLFIGAGMSVKVSTHYVLNTYFSTQSTLTLDLI